MRHDYDFRWNAWNLEHATRHGCIIEEIEHLVRNPPHSYPRKIRERKYFVVGRGQGGRLIQVIYVLDDPPVVRIFVIHAIPLTTRRRR